MLNGKGGFHIVHRKGNKWQQVPISREGFKPLHDYLTKHRSYLAALGGKTVARKEDAVFLSMTGEPLTDGGIWMLFYRLRKRTGITGVLCRITWPSGPLKASQATRCFM